jgi:hypothetical protein
MRMLITLAAVATLLPSAASAQAYPRYSEPSNPRASPLEAGPQRYKYDLPKASRWDAWNLDQLTRWGAAGQCVVARDRAASLALVSAKAGSAEAHDAAQRLARAFDACLAGSGIVARRNFALRRAAVADALGVRPPA